MIKNKWAAYLLYFVVFLAGWNLLDFLITAFITRGTYTFTAAGDLGLPAVLALITGWFTVLRNWDKKNK